MPYLLSWGNGGVRAFSRDDDWKGWIALILATARHHDLKLVTGDEHFRHLSDCIVL